MRSALVEHRFRDDVIRLRAEAVDLGVAAIPTFVANQSAVVGIVADDKLLRIVAPDTLTAINLNHQRDRT
jgi:predicted DsbA family dithiol-disulfide isomerase